MPDPTILAEAMVMPILMDHLATKKAVTNLPEQTLDAMQRYLESTGLPDAAGAFGELRWTDPRSSDFDRVYLELRGILNGLGGELGVRRARPTLRDAWQPHLFSPDFKQYTPGKHVHLKPGEPGAILSSNESPYGPPPLAVRRLLEDGVRTLFKMNGVGHLADIAIQDMEQDGTVFGHLTESLRMYMDDYKGFQDALAAYLGHGVKGDQIYVAAGASQLIYKLERAINPLFGGIMAFMPGFFMYPIGALAENRPFHAVFLNDDLTYPLDRFMQEAEDKDPALIFIDRPNNPTGGVVPAGWLRELVDARASRNGYVVIDEAYIDFNETRDGFNGLDLLDHPNVIVLRSFSKSLGLAGGRLAAGVAAQGSDAQTLFGRFKTPFEIATPVVELAMAALEPQALEQVYARLDEIVGDRRHLFYDLAEIPGIKTFASQGNFILIDVKGTGLTAGQVRERLERDYSLYVRPLPPNPQFVPQSIADRYELLRVTVGTPDQNKQFVDALKEIEPSVQPNRSVVISSVGLGAEEASEEIALEESGADVGQEGQAAFGAGQLLADSSSAMVKR